MGAVEFGAVGVVSGLCVGCGCLQAVSAPFCSLLMLFSPSALHVPLVQTGIKVIFLRDFLQIAENQEHLVPSPKLKF